jgi:mediator of RNA polymerase II transcription subunit 16
MNQYLLDRNDVSLHLLLCSSTRGLLVAVCRRLMHLEALSNRAIEFWEIKLSQQGDLGRMPTSALYNAYRRMHDITSSSHVKVQEFDQLLSMLGSDIRSAYARSLPAIVSKKANQAPPQPGAAVNKQFETSIKNLQAQFEQTMLLGGPAPPVFLPVIVKFFKAELVKFRAKPDTDPATLFFEDYSLLEIEDDRKGLANRAARNSFVDVFKRVELVAPQGGQRSSDGAIDGKASSGGTTVQGTNGSGQWRRCTRCTAVMEDVFGQRPGFSFVLGQQKKCSCGGYWGLLPRGSMIN